MKAITTLTIVFVMAFFTAKAQEKTYDVIIIGGGLSGLTSAHYLQSDDFLILEKKAKTGGRIIDGNWKNFHYPKGTEYMDEPDGALKNLIDDLKLKTIQIPPPTDGIAYKGKIYTKKEILDFLPSKKYKRQFNKLDRKFSRISRKTKDVIWEGEPIGKTKKYDNVTVKQWLDKYKIHPLIQRYVEIENLGLFSANNNELSIFYNANEMAYDMPSSKKYDKSEVFTFPNGMIDLNNALEKECVGKIKNNTEVVNVTQKNGIVWVEALVEGKAVMFKTKKLICTTPAPIAAKLLKNSVSKNAINQLNKIDYGQYFTINIFTSKRWLHQAWTISCLDNYFTSMYDVTRTQTKPDYRGESIISAYIPSFTCTDKKFIYQTDKEVFDKTIKDMEQYFPGISKTVIDYDVQEFQYAYPVFGIGYYEILTALNNDKSLQKNIFLAGDYMKYAVIDGAILSGVIAAKKVNKSLNNR